MSKRKRSKSFRYRLYPTKEQEQSFRQMCGNCRWLWNYLRHLQKKFYKKTEKFIPRFDMQAMLPGLKEEYDWLWECGSSSYQIVCANMDKALMTMKKLKRGFINYKDKSDKNTSFSFTCPKWKDSAIRIPKLGWVPWVKHCPMEGRPLRCTITKEGDEWYASISCEIIEECPRNTNWETVTGVDCGLKKTVALSDGTVFENPRPLQQLKKKLSRAQRVLARRKRGSNNRLKAKQRVNRIHKKIARKRRAFLNKIVHEITSNYGGVIVEGFRIDELMQKEEKSKKHKKNRNKAIADVSWGKLKELLAQKCNEKGLYFCKIEKYAPTNKTCVECGHIQEKSPKKDFICEKCGHSAHKIVNSAKVVQKMDENYCNQHGLVPLYFGEDDEK